MSDFIVNWAFSDMDPNKILEPSCGNGVFFHSIIEYFGEKTSEQPFSIQGIEIIKDEANISNQYCSSLPQLTIQAEDFFLIFNNKLKHEKYDLIIGNPPYIRYQYLTVEQRELQSQILLRNEMKSNKLINAWVAFVVACVEILSDNSKIGLVIPAELMQVSYAQDLRKFLINSLSRITIIAFSELIFPEVQQEVILLLGEKKTEKSNNTKKAKKGKKTKCEFNFIQKNNIADLNDCILLENTIPGNLVEHSSDKWTKYFLNEIELFVIRKLKQDTRFQQFSAIIKVDVGITTGANKYFSVNKDTVEEYHLQNVTCPLIGRSSHSRGIFFTKEDWEYNQTQKSDAFLIKFPDIALDTYPKKHKEYITYGKLQGIPKGYKCSVRKTWYIVPSVYSPDAFFLRRNDKFPKFVFNEINAVSTDTMHRVKLKRKINPKIILLSYYNSIALAFTEIEGRSHGGGVLELMPGEVENLLVPILSDSNLEKIDSLISKLDKIIRTKRNIDSILDEIDAFIIEQLNLNPIIPRIFRIIWKKLMYRRQNRKKKNAAFENFSTFYSSYILTFGFFSVIF